MAPMGSRGNAHGFSPRATRCRTLPHLSIFLAVIGLHVQFYLVFSTRVRAVVLTLKSSLRREVVVTQVRVILTCARLPSASSNWNLCLRRRHTRDYADFYHLGVMFITQWTEVLIHNASPCL